MNIKYGTLIDYEYVMTHYCAIPASCVSANKHIKQSIAAARKLQQQILAAGALDPANPQTRDIIGEDLYDIATHNGILFYPDAAKYIHNTIHTDNVYRILPKNPYVAALNPNGDYMVEKMIVNYEYFLDETNPPINTKRALICVIGDLIDFMTTPGKNFRNQLAFDRPFIQRWFEKIR